MENCWTKILYKRETLKVFLFGSNGFVGQNLLLTSGFDFTCIDNNFLGNAMPETTVKADIRNDQEKIAHLFDSCNEDFCVVNLAAIHSIPYCNKNPGEALHVNVYGNQKIFEAAYRSRCRHFIFASSGAVYKPDISIHSEDDTIESSDIYSSSKIMCESYLRGISSEKEIKVTSLRFFNIVGKYDLTPHLIPDIFDQILSNKDRIELGNLKTLRDYVHVDDVCSAIRSVLTNSKGTGFRAFNVCTGQGLSGEQIVDLALEVSQSDKDIYIDQGRFRVSDRPSQIGSFDRLESEYGWRPEKNIQTAMREYLSWRLSN